MNNLYESKLDVAVKQLDIKSFVELHEKLTDVDNDTAFYLAIQHEKFEHAYYLLNCGAKLKGIMKFSMEKFDKKLLDKFKNYVRLQKLKQYD
jgi:hypothetical protein